MASSSLPVRLPASHGSNKGNRKKLMRELTPLLREILSSRPTNAYTQNERRDLRLKPLRFAELITFHFGLSLKALSEFKLSRGKTSLKKLVDLIFDIDCEYPIACADGLLNAPISLLRQTFYEKAVEAYGGSELIDSNPFSPRIADTLTCSWAQINETGGIHSREKFRACFEGAKSTYLTWLATFYKKGRDAAHIYLRENLWSDSRVAIEARLVAAKVDQYDNLLSVLDEPTVPASFPQFSKLPNELRQNIWRHTFEPRVVEIQFYITEPSRWWLSFVGLKRRDLIFQKVARYGFPTEIPMNEVWGVWEAEFGVQQRMINTTKPKRIDSTLEEWEERYLNRLDYVDDVGDGDCSTESDLDDSAEFYEYDEFYRGHDEGTGPFRGLGPANAPGTQAELNVDPKIRKCLFTSPVAPPIALSVDKLSRAEALFFYKKHFVSRYHEGSGIYVNFDRDEILLDSETFGRFIFQSREIDLHFNRMPGWYSGLSQIDKNTKSCIKNMSMSLKLLHRTWYFQRKQIKDNFPALERLSLIYKTSSPVNYRYITDYRIQQAFNKKFPKHNNYHFEQPYMRYLDKPEWCPGHDYPTTDQGIHHDGQFGSDKYPGVYPFTYDFLLKLQRSSIKFRDIGPRQPPFPHDGYQQGKKVKDVKDLKIRNVHLWRGKAPIDFEDSEKGHYEGYDEECRVLNAWSIQHFWDTRDEVYGVYVDPEEIVVEKKVFENDIEEFRSLLQATNWG